jgi:hypothetical protein
MDRSGPAVEHLDRLEPVAAEVDGPHVVGLRQRVERRCVVPLKVDLQETRPSGERSPAGHGRTHQRRTDEVALHRGLDHRQLCLYPALALTADFVRKLK